MKKAIEVLESLRATGQRQVTIEPLLGLLRTDDANEAEMLRARLAYDRDQHSTAFEAANGALRTAILVNGGAAVAVLTFLGDLSKEKPALALAMSGSLGWFGGGVLIGAIATGLAYTTQLAYAKQKREVGIGLNWLAGLSVTAAYGGFALGLYYAFDAFKSGVVS